MNLIVCIKQVPEAAEIEFDTATRRIVRENVENVVNPFDRRALAEAIRLRDAFGGQVIVVTMGPPQARNALIECLAAGADRAIHLNDKAFAGADTLATARALALALKNESFDIIFCGKYSIDAETGQVGPELAELLDIPQVTGATKIDVAPDQRSVTVERETDLGFETIECDLPVLLTAAERLVRPIKIKDADLEHGSTKPVKEVTARDLADDDSIFGIRGSPTVVVEIKSLARTRSVEMIAGFTAEEMVQQLIERLERRAVFKPGGGDTGQPQARRPAPDTPSTREVWAVAELLEGELRAVSFELLGKGIELADKLAGSIGALVAGPGAGNYTKTLAAYGAERVYFAEDESLKQYSTAAYTRLLVSAIQTYQPVAVLIPSTANGRDLAPRVAARLAVGLTADCIDLDIDERGELVQYKPAFGGNIVALIVTRTLPKLATVRPGMLKAAVPDYSRTATVTCLPVPKPDQKRSPTGPLVFNDNRARLISVRKEVGVEVCDMEQARAVVCVGIGIGGPENLFLADDLARALGGVVGATRRVVDQGWLPRQQQIGLTGRIVSPDLYIGLGVRGAFNHTIGIQQSGTIVAINTDPSAEIFQAADFGLVGDVKEIAPALARYVRLLGKGTSDVR